MLIVPLLLACAQQPGTAQQAGGGAKGPIKLGALMPMTGYEPEEYLNLKRGMLFAIEEAGGEVAGRKIEYLEEDTATDPVIAGDKARKLVENDKVDVIFGPLFSHEGIPVAQYLARSGIPLMGFRGYGMDIYKFNNKGKVFQPLGTLAGIAYPFGKYAYDKLGYKTAIVMYDDYDAGQNFTAGFEKGFTERGGQIIQRVPSPLGTMDFASYLPGLKKADAVIVWYIPPTFRIFMKQYNDSGLKMPVMTSYANILDEGSLAEIGPLSLGMKGPGSWSPEVDNPVSKKFVEAYQKKHNKRVGGFEASAYLATGLYIQAVKATGGDTTPDKIINALLNLKADTIEGPMSFSPEGIATGTVYIFEAAKVGDRYVWKPIDASPPAVRKSPAE